VAHGCNSGRAGEARGTRLPALLLLLLATVAGCLWVTQRSAAAELRVVDDAGREVVLPAPARRIVSLAPHLTEQLFHIGAGARVVGTVEFSDFPPAARAIPRIGGSGGVDLERLLALRPDLVVAWSSGNPKRVIDRLARLRIPVYLDEPRGLADIARSLERLGALSGRDAAGAAAAAEFMERARALAARYRDRLPVRVFYQVLDPRLITVNGDHLISELLSTCGGVNVFAELPVLAPIVSEEAVLARDPDAIVAGGTEGEWERWAKRWRERAQLKAVRRGALYFVAADLVHRHSVRVLEGAERLCAALDDARRRR